jgi:hypothetical protein
MPDPVYVTTGAWGAGGGVPLSAAEIDTNFYRVVQRIVSLETDPPIGPYVTSVALAGTSFTMGLSDGSTLGPITFTIPMPRWRGDWQPLTTYHALDFFHAPSGELGAVLYDHVSESSFDWGLEVDTAGDLAYRNISGSATGQLGGLSGVVLTSPTVGDSLIFDGTNWVNGAVVSVSTIDDLTDVEINDAQDLDDLSYDSAYGVWVNRAHRDVITVPYHPGAFSSNENFFYYIFPRDGYIPANFGTRDGYQSGSGGTVNATSSTVITASRAAAGDLSDFSETVGTITIAAGHVEGTFATNSGTVKNFSAGDVLRLRAPSSADGTFAGFYATLVFITA